VTAGSASVLVEGQYAQFDLGTGTEPVPSRLLGFNGSLVVLAPLSTPAETTMEAVPESVGRACYVFIDIGGRLQALRARLVTGAEHEFVFQLTDDFRLGQRRRHSRAPLALPAQLQAAGQEPWSTFTRDISAGGVRVGREGADVGAGHSLSLTISLAPAEHEIKAECEVVRATDSDLSLRFVEIGEVDRQLLLQLTVAFYRSQ
jgi:PilZ domain